MAFQARLLALARSHEVLTREGWTGADLGEWWRWRWPRMRRRHPADAA
ncbi:HWE histidine kinase domain-containing protein [Siccirubricoccus deserti]